MQDEEGWAELRTRYSNLMEKFANVREESIFVIQNNRDVVDKLSEETLQFYRERLENAEQGDSNMDNRQASGPGSAGQPEAQENERDERDDQREDEENINWEQRFYELSEQYNGMSKEYESLYEELQRRMNEEEKQHDESG